MNKPIYLTFPLLKKWDTTRHYTLSSAKKHIKELEGIYFDKFCIEKIVFEGIYDSDGFGTIIYTTK